MDLDETRSLMQCSAQTKIGEIATEFPPKGAKTCFVLFLSPMQNGLSDQFRPFLKQKTWIYVHMRTPVRNFQVSAQGVLEAPKQLKMGNFEGEVLFCRVLLKRTIAGDGNYFGG